MQLPDLKLGIIGFGEVGSGFARGLKESGLHNIVAYDKFWDTEPFGPLIQKRAREAGVKLVDDLGELAQNCNLLIVAVATSVAKEVALETSRWLKKGQLYVDVSSSAPALKKELHDIVTPTGCKFVDVAIVGPLPVYGHKVPMLACGDGAELFKELCSPYGMDITVIGKHPGQASAIKMFRSIFMKGIEALFLEMLLAAYKYNADEQVLASIAETLEKTPFIASANRYVTGDAIHAARRVHEMEGVISTLREMGIEPIMSEATKRRLEWSAGLGLKEYFGGQTPSSYKEVLAAIEKILAQRSAGSQ
ncbi:MAG: hypothetical protein PWP65_1107 [Clostridia bacterium]|nr:hypothetical protein [Clostridia bacterium]